MVDCEVEMMFASRRRRYVDRARLAEVADREGLFGVCEAVTPS